MKKDSHEDKLLRTSRTFFGRWQGAHGQMWTLTASIKSLNIVLWREWDEGNLLIACLDPQRISGPVRWTNSCPELRVHESLPDGGRGFCLVDEAAGLEIVCGRVEISENVKLYNGHALAQSIADREDASMARPAAGGDNR